jgi:hypothetical protein
MASVEPADLRKKVKTALDETRLLILGAQVLFGFQLNFFSLRPFNTSCKLTTELRGACRVGKTASKVPPLALHLKRSCPRGRRMLVGAAGEIGK